MATTKATKSATTSPTKSMVTAGSNLQDLLALKKKLIQQNTNRGSGDRPKYLPWFKVEVGNTVKVRLLPLKFNNNMPFITVKEHRNLYPDANFRAVVCPRSVGAGECPICEYIDEHYREARENDDKGAVSAIRPLFGKPRAYALLYNRVTQQIEKIGMSTTLLGQILSELDDDFGDPTDVHTGRDGKISAVKGSNGFNNYSYSHSDLSTPLADDEEKIDAILAELDAHESEIMKLKTPMNYDEIKALLSAGVEDMEDSNVVDGDDEEITDDDVSKILSKIKGSKS